MTGCERAAVEAAARDSYGRLLAHLAARFRDIAAAEDALSEAFAAALIAWPLSGLPANPDGWLYAAARRRLIDARRKAATAAGAAEYLILLAEESAAMTEAPFPDQRLGLLFACAHPAVDPTVRTALMLQTVLGLTAERIAPAFLTTPAAISQRLVRAKRKIRDTGATFSVPDPEAWAERMPAVLDAVYAAYGDGWSARGALAEEALWLGRVLAGLAPQEPEGLGLLALMLHLEARAPARRSADGAYVPLGDQDTQLWRVDLIEEANALLHRAARAQSLGRFQLEAAIQSAHAARRTTGAVDWGAVVALYEALAAMTGSPVAALNLAAALAERDGPSAGITAMAPLTQTLKAYQPFWALKAHLAARTGDRPAAAAAYDRAIALESDPAMRAFLAARRDGL